MKAVILAGGLGTRLFETVGGYMYEMVAGQPRIVKQVRGDAVRASQTLILYGPT